MPCSIFSAQCNGSVQYFSVQWTQHITACCLEPSVLLCSAFKVHSRKLQYEQLFRVLFVSSDSQCSLHCVENYSANWNAFTLQLACTTLCVQCQGLSWQRWWQSSAFILSCKCTLGVLYSSVQCVAMDWTDSAVQYSALDSAVQWLGLAEIKAGHDGGLTSPLLPWPHLSLLNIIFIVTVLSAFNHRR